MAETFTKLAVQKKDNLQRLGSNERSFEQTAFKCAVLYVWVTINSPCVVRATTSEWLM